MKNINFSRITIAILLIFGWTNSSTAQSIAAGGWHSLAICNDSTVKAFGENASGELGNGSNTDSNIPVTSIGLSGIIAVSGGGDQLEAHSLALKSNGTIWSWGSNIYGGLGNGTTTNSNTPSQVLVLTTATAISAGGWHSVALKNDGTVWTWGWNMDGQLGDGTIVDKVVPTQIPNLSGVIAISAGTYHTLALKSDGTVWAWGDNISGQIGDGTVIDRTSPTQVLGLTGVVKIAAGRFFSLAVKSDGTVWTWGENLYGQLGNGTNTDSHIPVQVSGLSGITSATAATGAFHCIAVKNDNTVWAWGRNTYGNLGDGTVANKSTPVLMQGISNVNGLAAGTNFTLLTKSDGTFWACGRNASGQLGDGTFTQRNLVTQAAGLCSILHPTGIINANTEELLNLNAFPNPSSNGVIFITIRSSSFTTDALLNGMLDVYNQLGEKIYSLPLNQHSVDSPIMVDLSKNPSGLYVIAVQTSTFAAHQKIIIK